MEGKNSTRYAQSTCPPSLDLLIVQHASRFLSIYESLPQDEQRALVEKYLAPLLDSAAISESTKALNAASSIQKRHAGMPTLDLRGKKAELSAMFEELSKDIKRSFVTESTSRNELLFESVWSLTSWLSDIWRVVYEHNVDFLLAHDCLLFVIEKLDQILNIRSGYVVCDIPCLAVC